MSVTPKPEVSKTKASKRSVSKTAGSKTASGKTADWKTAANSTAAETTAPKKAARKKVARKKAAPKKAAPKKAAPKKTVSKKAVSRKTVSQNTVSKKTGAKRASETREVAAHRAAVGSREVRAPITLAAAIDATSAWYAANDWTVFDFQRTAWAAWHAGESGLIHSPTGSGKTLAAWMGPLQGALAAATPPSGLQILWITPLRALANDTRRNLQQACDALGADLDVELRTGDTSSSRRSRQIKRPPFALVTTPESLSIMLTSPDCEVALGNVTTIVVDEWHELMGSKRGVQLELCLERVRSLATALRVWGLSATLANLDVALETLLGPGRSGTLVQGVVPRAIEIRSVVPAPGTRFPWAGHVGLRLIEPVADIIAQAATTLAFTNTRSQAELWYRALLEARPDWIDTLALHHGSIDRELREGIEERLRTGELRCVVCTSSLDLGVDFHPVDQVLQIGSPKAVARVMQRAGRSGHRPGAISRIVCVPTHSFELVEIAAVRRALGEGRIEGRLPYTRSLDVLAQHLVSVAMGTGFVEDDMRAEVRRTHAFAGISESEWRWTMDFVTRGGQALQGYPQYHKVLDVAGVYRVMNREVAQRHRTNIGTITGNASMTVAFLGGKRLGSMEESFIARLRPGDAFQFSGRNLELVMTKDLTAYVRVAKRQSRLVPRWQGTQLPLSSELSDTVLETLQAWREGTIEAPELAAIDDLLTLQVRWSHLPGPDDFLVEHNRTREGWSLFCYPFAGRLVHEGLAMLVAARLTLRSPSTYTLVVNDYGFELQSPTETDVSEATLRDVFSTEHLLDDIVTHVNTSEIARRRFRDIARIAGLVFEGAPGQRRSARQVQASSGLIFDVLAQHDGDNLLLEQARREVLEAQLELDRLRRALADIARCRWVITRPDRLSPLAFPLWAESVQSQTVSTETWKTRIERMAGTLEAAAAATLGETS